MKPLVLTIIVGLLAQTAMAGTQSRPRAQDILQGPYEFDEHAKPQPRFFVLDDKPYYSIDQRKLAISQLPPGSKLHWAGSCVEETAVELPPRPYMSLSAFRSFCRKHHVDFTWYFGR